MTQPGRGNPLIKNGEVHRVERSIAQARQGRYQQKARVACDHGGGHAGRNKNAHRHEQQWSGAQPIYNKAGTRLPNPGDHKKSGHEQT